MTAAEVMDLFREALYLAVIMVSVIILPSLIVGIIISIFQAATQINEQTLTFLPRLIATLIALTIAGPWLGNKVHEFTTALIAAIPVMVGF